MKVKNTIQKTKSLKNLINLLNSDRWILGLTIAALVIGLFYISALVCHSIFSISN